MANQTSGKSRQCLVGYGANQTSEKNGKVRILTKVSRQCLVGRGMVRLPIRQGKIRPKHPLYRWTFSTVTKNPLYGHSPPSTSTTAILNSQSNNPTTRMYVYTQFLLSVTKNPAS